MEHHHNSFQNSMTLPYSSQNCMDPPYSSQNSMNPSNSSNIIFQHPFTMMVTGPTGCGKTQWIRNLLTSDLIQPPPERIIYFYKRWQPLYDEIRPYVEFMNEIPPNLDKDDFINPRVRNLLIIDDMMTTVCKDPRITDLFTEGSHHRNLSVVVIQQNLYYGKDPTQRCNSQYIVLFKNPGDQTLIATLARQMFGNNHHYFTRQWQEATSKPYGHMIIDLKPNTPDHERLKSNIFDTGQHYNSWSPLMTTSQNPNIIQEKSQFGGYPESKPHMKYFDQSHNTKGVFQRPWNSIMNQEQESLWSDSSEDIHKIPSNSRAFKILVDKVLSDNYDEFYKLMEKYRCEGYTKTQAKLKTFEKNRKTDIKTFAKYYRQLLIILMHLIDSPLHKKIMATALSLIQGMTHQEAAEEAINQNMNKDDIDDIFNEHSGIEIPASSESEYSASSQSETDDRSQDETQNSQESSSPQSSESKQGDSSQDEGQKSQESSSPQSSQQSEDGVQNSDSSQSYYNN